MPHDKDHDDLRGPVSELKIVAQVLERDVRMIVRLISAIRFRAGHRRSTKNATGDVRMPQRTTVHAAIALVAMSALLLAGCTGSKAKHDSTATSGGRTSSLSGGAAASVSRTGAVAVGANQKVTIAATALTSDQRTGLTEAAGTNATFYVGQPVQLTTSKPVPSQGIRLTRTYAAAVPAGLDATFAFWDPTLGGWHAVPSTLSSDRRSVVAIVHHLSIWTDIVGSVTGAVGAAANAVKDFASDAADWAYYEVGKVFDTRVSAPTCSSNPTWVSSTTFIATERNNSLLFCTGHDPKHPDLVEVKARVNRGFAFTATVGADSSWQWNSTSATSPVTDARNALGHLDDALSRTFDALAPPGQVLVGAGKELDLGFSENQIRDAGTGVAVLTFAPPTVARFLISLVGELTGDILSDVQQGYTAAAIIISGCYDDLHDAKDIGGFVRAAKTCLAGLDEHVAGLLGDYLGKKRHLSPVEAGKLAGKLVARVSVYLALAGPAFSTMNFIGEQKLPASSRTVTVFPTVEAVTAATLRTAQVPADCRLPAQRLVNGVTTKGGPGGGSITTKAPLVGYADFAGLGYKQALTEYGCSAGGVSWPEELVLIGVGGKLLGSYDLATHDQQEHSDVRSVTVSGNSAAIAWDSYEGAGFYFVHHRATVRYSAGKLILDGEVDQYTPEAVVGDIIGAQYEKKRSVLRDPGVVSDATWNKLVGTYRTDSFQLDNNGSNCSTSGASAVCHGTYYDTSATTYSEFPVTFTLTKSSTTVYGWILTGLGL